MAPLRSGPAWWRLLSWAALGPVLCGVPGRAEPEPGKEPESQPDPHGRHLYSAEMLRHGAAAAPHFVMFFAPWWVSRAPGGRPCPALPCPALPCCALQHPAGPARLGMARRGAAPSPPASSPVDVAAGGGRAGGEAGGTLPEPQGPGLGLGAGGVRREMAAGGGGGPGPGRLRSRACGSPHGPGLAPPRPLLRDEAPRLLTALPGGAAEGFVIAVFKNC